MHRSRRALQQVLMLNFLNVAFEKDVHWLLFSKGTSLWVGFLVWQLVTLILATLAMLDTQLKVDMCILIEPLAQIDAFDSVPQEVL